MLPVVARSRDIFKEEIMGLKSAKKGSVLHVVNGGFLSRLTAMLRQKML